MKHHLNWIDSQCLVTQSLEVGEAAAPVDAFVKMRPGRSPSRGKLAWYNLGNFKSIIFGIWTSPKSYSIL